MKFYIGKHLISNSSKTYFIADIAANHDGKIERAKKLIYLAAKAGANGIKFQNFFAETIVSDYGFKSLKKKLSHQSKWKKSVFQVYKDAELPLLWSNELKKTCTKVGVDYLTAPYDNTIIKYLNKFVCCWKIGSGDITWHEHILKIAKTKKPIIIASGASNIEEIDNIIKKLKKINNKIVLMQCNTNYEADINNLKYINLNVLKTFKDKFPNAILGLSDHTHGHETVLGAIALGAKVIEKHFTDSNNRIGPDHYFSMNPKSWNEMVIASRKLESSLGSNIKIIEKNEKTSVILQRRSIRSNKIIKKGNKITKADLCYLRPCPKNGLKPTEYKKIINKKAKKQINFHEIINLKNTK
jgi:sialic acid synthase SpsE